MNELQEEIKQLKKMKHAVILAHYYVPDEVQEIADYIGDSFYLSRKVRDTEADVLVFAGVSFMGESAKILNPEKKYCFRIPKLTVPWHIWQMWKPYIECERNIRIWRWSVTLIPRQN